ncbi:unnamed protein product [Cyprideis torosa]|uniref:Uncharacterized protein n=1 Tax=Cyprideis torosa TaxID=163714 RepID=A0A7R8WDV3_9CRUS|nr:unnamed protein product [Cyprideis torosa]CAG0892194.1 unnamed protein product [Cyprideis torosa]
MTSFSSSRDTAFVLQGVEQGLDLCQKPVKPCPRTSQENIVLTSASFLSDGQLELRWWGREPGSILQRQEDVDNPNHNLGGHHPQLCLYLFKGPFDEDMSDEQKMLLLKRNHVGTFSDAARRVVLSDPHWDLRQGLLVGVQPERHPYDDLSTGNLCLSVSSVPPKLNATLVSVRDERFVGWRAEWKIHGESQPPTNVTFKMVHKQVHSPCEIVQVRPCEIYQVFVQVRPCEIYHVFVQMADETWKELPGFELPPADKARPGPQSIQAAYTPSAVNVSWLPPYDISIIDWIEGYAFELADGIPSGDTEVPETSAYHHQGVLMTTRTPFILIPSEYSLNPATIYPLRIMPLIYRSHSSSFCWSQASLAVPGALPVDLIVSRSSISGKMVLPANTIGVRIDVSNRRGGFRHFVFKRTNFEEPGPVDVLIENINICTAFIFDLLIRPIHAKKSENLVIPSYNITVSIRSCRFETETGLRSWLYRACSQPQPDWTPQQILEHTKVRFFEQSMNDSCVIRDNIPVTPTELLYTCGKGRAVNGVLIYDKCNEIEADESKVKVGFSTQNLVLMVVGGVMLLLVLIYSCALVKTRCLQKSPVEAEEKAPESYTSAGTLDGSRKEDDDDMTHSTTLPLMKHVTRDDSTSRDSGEGSEVDGGSADELLAIAADLEAWSREGTRVRGFPGSRLSPVQQRQQYDLVQELKERREKE